MIERLESYTQVRVGDFLPTRADNNQILAQVCETTASGFYYSYKKSDGIEFTRGVAGEQGLENLVLIRINKQQGTRILAGKQAYDAFQSKAKPSGLSLKNI